VTACFDAIWQETRPAFRDERTWKRARDLALSVVACLGRRTVSGLLCAQGRQFRDWSAAYRLFEKERFDLMRVFDPIRKHLLLQLSPKDPLVAHLDDTHTKKWGKKVSGASWRRDPLGPKFQTQFLWGQRFLQISMALPEGETPCRSRAVPVDFVHAPSPGKIPKKASEEEKEKWRREKKEKCLTRVALNRAILLRQKLDEEPGGKDKPLILSFDGGYTNVSFFARLPDRVTGIGRVRKDACLHRPPVQNLSGRGRKRVYGERLPTPDEIRKDESIPWTEIAAWAAGKIHPFKVKILDNVRWKGAGPKNQKLLVIKPLGYRLSAKSRILYRQPAYILCSDPQLPVEKILQYYIWRGEIEVNFRDEKTLLGMGDAQVRTEKSVERAPAFVAAVYACLLLASHQAFGVHGVCPLPKPKWQKTTPEQRCSTHQMISRVRAELWGKALGLDVGNFKPFANAPPSDLNATKLKNSIAHAVVYA